MVTILARSIFPWDQHRPLVYISNTMRCLHLMNVVLLIARHRLAGVAANVTTGGQCLNHVCIPCRYHVCL